MRTREDVPTVGESPAATLPLCFGVRVHITPQLVRNPLGHALAWSWAYALIAARHALEVR